MENLVPIGQFAAASRLSLKVLRLLRRAGMPLGEIRAFLADPSAARQEEYEQSLLSELWNAHQPTGSAFTVYHGEVNEEDDGPVEVGVPTAAGDRRLPAGEVALTIATGDQCGFPEIIGAYDAVASWAKENGRELDGSPREIYHSDPGKGEEDRFEIAWPIR